MRRRRTIAITDATGGLGVALATKLRERKANVALLDLDGGAAERLAHDLGGTRVAWGTSVDVCSLESVEQAMACTSKHFSRIDVVIAAAGIGNVWGTLTSTAEESWEKVIDVNLNGVWRTFTGLVHPAYAPPHSRCAVYRHALSDHCYQ